ncbi:MULTISPECIES: hypothetical protein [Nocardia]|uniref:hypothetical protein n=1 Tax=Nocardia TaxID=1817 RepID=UPI0024563990|nr:MULTISPECIES: hypothetical protein [Nocardia]
MPDQTTGRPTDEELRQIAEDPWVSYAPDVPRRMAIELRELRARVAELEAERDAAQRLAEEVSQRADYGGVFRAIHAGIEHVVDYRDEWRKLTRAELIDKLMVIHHAGLMPRISEAVVGLASAVGRDILRERDRLATRVAELDADRDRLIAELRAAKEARP